MDKSLSINNLIVGSFLFIAVFLPIISMQYINPSIIIMVYITLITLIAIFIYTEKCVYLFLGVFTFLEPPVNAVMLTLLFVVYILKGRKRKIIFPNKAYSIALFLMWSSHFLGFISASNSLRVVSEITAWSVYIILFFLLRMIVEYGELKSIHKSLIYNSILIIIILIIKSFFYGAYVLIDGLPLIRFPSTNYLAMFLLLMIPIIIGLSQTTNSKHERNCYWLIIMSIMITLILVNARGAWGLGLLVIGYQLLKNFISSMKLLIVALLGIGLMYMFFSSQIIEFYYDAVLQFNSIFNKNHYSNYIRLELWKDIFKNVITTETLIWGVGAGNFDIVYEQISTIGFPAKHAHNIFIHTLVELGIIGFVSQLVLFSVIILRLSKALRLIKRDNKEYKYIWSIRLSITLFLIYGMLEAGWTDSRFAFLFFILIALSDKLTHINQGGAKCTTFL